MFKKLTKTLGIMATSTALTTVNAFAATGLEPFQKVNSGIQTITSGFMMIAGGISVAALVGIGIAYQIVPAEKKAALKIMGYGILGAVAFIALAATIVPAIMNLFS